MIIATQQPVASDLRLVTASFTVGAELERMGDYCSGIAKLTLQMVDEPLGGHLEDIHDMSNITRELLVEALEAFKDRDLDAAEIIWRRDEEVDDLYRDFFQLAISEMADDQTTIRRDTYLLWVAHNSSGWPIGSRISPRASHSYARAIKLHFARPLAPSLSPAKRKGGLGVVDDPPNAIEHA